MRLADFIVKEMRVILQEWEDFARSLGETTSSMDRAALRDHAESVLRAIVADLRTAQSAAQQEAKSKGYAPAPHPNLLTSAAFAHGSLRANEGFSLSQMISEYRALRASVLRLWARERSASEMTIADSSDDQIRFDEAIDEALASSIQAYSLSVEQMFETKARRRMEAMGTLAAGLGHDMTSMLLPMRGSLDVLAKVALTPEAAPALDALRGAVRYLGGISEGLRALSIDPDDCDSSPTVVLHEWWARAILACTWTMSKRVHLHVDGLDRHDRALPPVRIPAHALMQAVFNLVQNASQAMRAANPRPAGSLSTKIIGNIWISAGMEAAPQGAGTEAMVRLTIRDDGPGMDESTVARCTKAFFSTRPKDQGAGLGLYLVRTTLETHGGKLLVHSKVGEGTVFTLLLPVADAEVPVVTTLASPAPSARAQ